MEKVLYSRRKMEKYVQLHAWVQPAVSCHTHSRTRHVQNQLSRVNVTLKTIFTRTKVEAHLWRAICIRP